MHKVQKGEDKKAEQSAIVYSNNYEDIYNIRQS